LGSRTARTNLIWWATIKFSMSTPPI
jgi:hypothetical protein